MTDIAMPAAWRTDPGSALQARFEAIAAGPMAGLPMVNPRLRVQALGFRRWNGHWLGVLVTPWFMNLVLMPGDEARWPRAPERESRFHVFPAGVFEFIGACDPALGDYQACSLFSPMFEFDDPEVAAATALAAISALFDSAHRPRDRSTPMPAAAPQADAAAAKPTLSKRDFLFGTRGCSDAPGSGP